MTMYKKTKTLILLAILFSLSSCGDGPPSFTQFVMKSNEFGVLLDTTDDGQLSELHDLFYERKEESGAGPEFKYIIDITTSEGKTRWQYSIDGYIMAFGGIDADKTIYKIARVIQFNKLAKVR